MLKSTNSALQRAEHYLVRDLDLKALGIRVGICGAMKEGR